MKRIRKIALHVALSLALLVVMVLFGFAVEHAHADTVGRQNVNDLKFSYMYSLTGTGPYVRFINKHQGKVWDDNASALGTTATWTDTDVALTTKMAANSIGGWLIPIPSALPDGVYDMLLYDVSTAAGSRSVSDAISSAGSKHIIVKGARIVQMSDI